MLCHVPCSGPHFARMARSDRQRLLREQYFFDCCCPTCLRGCVCIRQVVCAAMQFCCTLTGCPAPGPVQLLLPATIEVYILYLFQCCWRGGGRVLLLHSTTSLSKTWRKVVGVSLHSTLVPCSSDVEVVRCAFLCPSCSGPVVNIQEEKVEVEVRTQVWSGCMELH